jgi:hypothetical protein
VCYSTFYKHFEADDFWKDKEFDPSLLKEAHRVCQENTRKALEDDWSVIVSNTFTQLWEMQPYFDMTKDVTVFRMTGDYGSIHNVPQQTINKMKQRFEDYKGEIYV